MALFGGDSPIRTDDIDDGVTRVHSPVPSSTPPIQVVLGSILAISSMFTNTLARIDIDDDGFIRSLFLYLSAYFIQIGRKVV